MKDINTDWIEAAIKAAKTAANAIMEIYAKDFDVERKADFSPVTIADKASSKIILAELASTGIPVISEEEKIPSYKERKNYEYVWIVDPLDGTKEFIRKNDEFCICIALVHKEKSIFGLLASPTEKTILIGGAALGTAYYFDFETYPFFDPVHEVPSITSKEKKTLAYSRSHFSDKAQSFIDQLERKYGELAYIKKGSALKFIDLALSRADFYPRLAPTMEWDIAAGQAIYESLGGEVLDFTNFEPLSYNKEDLYNPYFIAKNKDLTI